MTDKKDLFAIGRRSAGCITAEMSGNRIATFPTIITLRPPCPKMFPAGAMISSQFQRTGTRSFTE